MRRYNIVSRILLILTVITFALAAPALVQDKHQTCVDVVAVPEDVITVLGKRTREEEMNLLWRYYNNVWRNRNPAVIHLQEPAPPPNVPPPNPAEVHVPEVHAPPPNPAGVQVPEAHVPPQGPADSDHESMESDDNAPPAIPEEGSTESEDWHAPPSVQPRVVDIGVRRGPFVSDLECAERGVPVREY